jgi:hypothetical protein
LRFLILTIVSLLCSSTAVPRIVTLSALPDTVGQGKTLSVEAVFASPPDMIGGEFLGDRLPFFPVDSLTYRALAGIPIKLDPGPHEMIIRARGKARTSQGTQPFQVESRLVVTVLQTEFRKTSIDLPSPAMSKLTVDNLTNEGNTIGPKFRTCSGKKMWQMKFISPAKGPISSPFGCQRVYGDGKLSWHHKGVDIAAPVGDSVLSCGAGTVILCRDFVVHGRTVMIDHGHGVVSIYCHLNEIKARVGDVLKRGDLIGTVGGTGVGTGPHLHWGVSVGNVRVDPMEWLDRYIR